METRPTAIAPIAAVRMQPGGLEIEEYKRYFLERAIEHCLGLSVYRPL